MLKSLSVLCLLAGAAFAQSFPSSIFTPYVSADNIATTLSTSMLSSDTSAFVASNTGFVANMLAYICDSTTSTTKCTGTFEVMLVTGTSGANVINVTRAQGGTSAVAHAAGATLSNAPVALYNTSLNNEVHAIETTLGPNLNKISQSTVFNSSTYNFTPIVSGSGVTVSGGNLVIGNNTLTFATVPLGTNGADANHWLYISQGTGTAEACLINGGSGTSGGINGQIIVNCGNTHSGLWSVASATAGIREAIIAGGNYAHISIPAGSFNVYATIYSEFGASIHGAGSYNTFLTWQTASIDGIHILGSNGIVGEIGDMRLLTTAGSISASQHGTALTLDTTYIGLVNGLEILGWDYGIRVTGGSSPFMRDVTCQDIAIVDLYMASASTSDAAGGEYLNLILQGWGASTGSTDGIVSVGTVAGAQFTNIAIGAMGGNAIVWSGISAAVNEIQMSNLVVDGIGGTCLYMEATAAQGGGGSHIYTNFRCTSGGGAGNYGVIIHSGFRGILIQNSYFNVGVDGFVLYGAHNINLVGDNIISYVVSNPGAGVNIQGDTDGTQPAEIYVKDSVIGLDLFSGASDQFTDAINISSSAIGNVDVENNRLNGSGNSIVVEGTGGSGVTYRFLNNRLTGGAIFNSAGGSAIVQLSGNWNGDLNTATVSSITSNTITLTTTGENTIICSADGSGGVQTITAPNGTLWVGRQVRIVATHASGIVFNTSGNIRVGKTLTTGQSVIAVWDGTKWDI